MKFCQRMICEAGAVAIALVLSLMPGLLQAAEEAAAPPKPTTTSDVEITVDQLELLVKPLTREELAVEAAGWRDLLKEKVEESSKLQVSAKQQTQSSEVGSEEEPGDAGADADETDLKAELVEKLPQLQEQRTQLIDRLNVVLDAWELKGGEDEEYRQYVSAVGGLEIDVTDASTTWAALQGWAMSEQGGQRWFWNILKFVLILGVFYILASIVSNLVVRASSRSKGSSELLKKFLGTFVKQVVLLIGLVIAASALEINISPLLAAIGGAAFVIGLALQGTLSNFASGLIILGYRPFDVGDVIEAAGITGIVDSMNLISTKIRTFDNKVMIVPNNKIATDTITNATASDTRRVDMMFGIGYDDDVEKSRGILESIVNNHELILKDPPAVIQLNELGDSSVNFICRPWTKAGDYWTVFWDVTRQVKEEFDRNGISIPFPQRDVHVYHENVAGDGQPLADATKE